MRLRDTPSGNARVAALAITSALLVLAGVALLVLG
jgi:hypothetical protein